MKLTVEDLIKLPREIEVPNDCPGCHQPFKEVGLKHWEYQDQSRAAGVHQVNGAGGLDWGSELPRAGDAYIPIRWECGGCGHELIENEEVSGPIHVLNYSHSYGSDVSICATLDDAIHASVMIILDWVSELDEYDEKRIIDMIEAGEYSKAINAWIDYAHENLDCSEVNRLYRVSEANVKAKLDSWRKEKEEEEGND